MERSWGCGRSFPLEFDQLIRRHPHFRGVSDVYIKDSIIRLVEIDVDRDTRDYADYRPVRCVRSWGWRNRRPQRWIWRRYERAQRGQFRRSTRFRWFRWLSKPWFNGRQLRPWIFRPGSICAPRLFRAALFLSANSNCPAFFKPSKLRNPNHSKDRRWTGHAQGRNPYSSWLFPERNTRATNPAAHRLSFNAAWY